MTIQFLDLNVFRQIPKILVFFIMKVGLILVFFIMKVGLILVFFIMKVGLINEVLYVYHSVGTFV